MDFGCGPGFYNEELARKAERVVAVDLSPEILKKAQRKAAKQALRILSFCRVTVRTFRLKTGQWT